MTVCGGCLLTWAHYGARPDLWPLGLPIAIVGQVVLLIGLVLHLDALRSPVAEEPQDEERRKTLPFGDGIRLDSAQRALSTRSTAGTDSVALQDLAARLDEISARLDRDAG